MRYARKLVLLALTAAATMALTTQSAQALEITTEATGVHCSSIMPVGAEPFITHGTGSGGCPFRLHSVGTVEVSVFGQMTECNFTLEGRSNELGEGYFYFVALTNCSPSVTRPCDANNDGVMENWIFHLNAESGTNAFEVRLCLTMNGFTSNCHLFLDIAEPTPHRYRFSTGGVHRNCEQFGVSIRATWEQEVDAVHHAIEIKG
jgi:hypothetical protein